MKQSLKQNKALILGATGGIGSEVANQLSNAGWYINALKRRAHTMSEKKNITWFEGDALNQADVEAAAEDCQIILHGVNPAGYKNWGTLVLPMLDNTIAVAKKTGACIVLPGTIYNYGPDAFPVIHETSPQNPTTKKGRIRVEMERRLQGFANSGGKVIIVRAGDFFGPSAANSWFSQGLIKPNQAIKNINNPSEINIGHQWAYLPDVAKVMVKLIETRDTLDSFSTFHMNGFWDEDGVQMAKSIRRVVERSTGRTPNICAFPWWQIRFLTPFNQTLKELMEMKYLWQNTIRMDNSKLIQQLGYEPFTPIDKALENTLKELNCLN
ncbi:NAD-dependent epimerase/dehydratase family protein [Marinomonas foliarum]|jgi:nucleoside-diphosphate-sugar epimerase|uniref:Nucleoside-diphosphate-sugar epimerase n=1 Tax=Marinomonas foliarum TaxID=491950 RepID=A0A369AF80_9GAMM|nr:NAD-dependent epimerase/dehydratase family protein [Marinomonas foliarum]RCX08000.1 nucleoside-diphosphate-sugar epimerase [Marinomonas foliarum]